MYTEEVDFCRRVWQAGMEVRFLPEPRVVHHWGGATMVNRRIVVWSSGSQIIYFKKHFRGFSRRLICCLKYLSIANRAAAYTLAGALKSSPALRIKGAIYLWALRTLLRENWSYVEGGTGPAAPWKHYS
jgi:GT2 family glycosyltransferase